MGDFAQQSLPIYDEVTITILRVNNSTPEKFTVRILFVTSFSYLHILQLPYRSRISPAAANWTDSSSFRANNCVAIAGTNGVDLYAPSTTRSDSTGPISLPQQQPNPSKLDTRKYHVGVSIGTDPQSNIILPPELQPPVPVVNGSFDVAHFYMLNDNVTGVLALGDFLSSSYYGLQTSLLEGLTNLTKLGATQLVVDVVRAFIHA
jgi:hypothetical protein